MALILDLRIIVRDNGVSKRFTDDDLSVFLKIAIDELNAWCKTTVTLSDLEDPVTISEPYQRRLVLDYAKMLAIKADIQDTKRYAKFVTQDVQYDPSDIATRLNRTLDICRKEFEAKLKKWVGLDISGWTGIGSEVDSEVSV